MRILALDLGKRRSVACINADSGDEVMCRLGTSGSDEA